MHRAFLNSDTEASISLSFSIIHSLSNKLGCTVGGDYSPRIYGQQSLLFPRQIDFAHITIAAILGHSTIPMSAP
jgi:hypothetical protein